MLPVNMFPGAVLIFLTGMSTPKKKPQPSAKNELIQLQEHQRPNNANPFETNHTKTNNMSPALASPYSRTDLSKKDKVHALLHKIEGRLTFFQQQVDYRMNHSDYHDYFYKLLKFNEIATTHLLNLHSVANRYNCNKTLGDISKKDIIQRTNRYDRYYREAYNWIKEWDNDRWRHLYSEIGIKQPERWYSNKESKWLTDQLKQGAKTRCSQISTMQLACEVVEARKNGWFIAFQTNTCAPHKRKEVFDPENQIWNIYVKRIRRLIEAATYGSHRAAKNQPSCFEYFTVIEEHQSGELHFHSLYFMKNIPAWRDPNLGKRFAFRTLIDEMEKYWKWGYSDTVAVRHSGTDAWGKKGWCWPCDEYCQPIPETHDGKLINYLLKYILKSEKNRKDLIKWRTKKSRSLGKKYLRQTMSRMKASRLYSLVLMTVYPTKIKLHGIKSPSAFIRNVALDELISRYRQRKNAKKRNLKALPADTRMRTLLKTGIRTNQDHKLPNSGDILAEILTGRVVSSRYMHDNWLKAKEELENAFPYIKAYTGHGGIIDGR